MKQYRQLLLIVMGIILTAFTPSCNNDSQLCPYGAKLQQVLYFIQNHSIAEVDTSHLTDIAIRTMMEELEDLHAAFFDTEEPHSFVYKPKIQYLFNLIRSHSIDEIDIKRITDVAIRAMLEELDDQHAALLDSERTQRFLSAMRGGGYGIGISFEMFADTLYVWNIAHDSPAQNAGLLTGDRIIYINDSLVAGIQLDRAEITCLLSGERGTTKDLQVLRRGVSDLMNFQVVSDSIFVNSVVAAYMVTDDIGYIRLNAFIDASIAEFQQAVQQLRAQGMKNLIFDLIDNTGGFLYSSSMIAAKFLEEGSILYQHKTSNERSHRIAPHGDSMLSEKLVVLVNEVSASGSEVFAGAIQDWDRGVIVGRRTFGKGTGQQIFPFDDGTLLRITNSKVFTPIGRSVERFDVDCEEEALRRNIANHQLAHNIRRLGIPVRDEWVHQLDSTKFTTLVNKRRLIAGGGIFPDYTVPQNAAVHTQLFNDLNENGIFVKAAISNVDNHRHQLLEKYPDVQTFQSNYQLPPTIVRQIQQMAEDSEITWNYQQFEASRSLILNTIKAYMARDLYNSTSAFFLVMNKKNEIFQTGLRIISNPEKYENLLKGIGAQSVLQVPIDEYNYAITIH